MDTNELEQAYLTRPQKTRYGYDIFIIAAIAQNPNASSRLLDEVAHLDHPKMNDRLGAIIDLTGKNRKRIFCITSYCTTSPSQPFNPYLFSGLFKL